MADSAADSNYVCKKSENSHVKCIWDVSEDYSARLCVYEEGCF